jgi:hypothetical protein
MEDCEEADEENGDNGFEGSPSQNPPHDLAQAGFAE